MATLAPNRADTNVEDELGNSDKDESLCDECDEGGGWEDSDKDESSVRDDVQAVNIAIVGKTGSGRSSFVNAILGYSTKFMHHIRDTKLVNRVTHYRKKILLN